MIQKFHSWLFIQRKWKHGIEKVYVPLLRIFYNSQDIEANSVPCCWVAQLCLTLSHHGHARLPCPSPSPGVCSNSCPLNWWCHLILCLLLPSIFPSIRVFSNESAHCIRWPKYWCFSFSSIPSNAEYSALISFRIDWFDLLSVQGTLKHQFFSTHPSSSFFMVQLSHPYRTTGKTILWLDRSCWQSDVSAF